MYTTRAGQVPQDFSPADPTVNEDLLTAYERVSRPLFRVYEPLCMAVVAGPSPRCRKDVRQDVMERDRVPLLHRLGGGGTALLSPGMLVLALVTSAASPFRNREYARRVNSWVAATLNRLGVTDVTTEGTADLAVHGRKILGSSVYRSGEIFFYQSSLLVSNDLSLFTRYLTFPSLAPDYRQGRGHEAFCATLHGLGHRLPLPVIRQEIEAECRERLGPLE